VGRFCRTGPFFYAARSGLALLDKAIPYTYPFAMLIPRKKRLVIHILLGVAAFVALVVGVTTGIAVASVDNIRTLERGNDAQAALPTQILDRHGKLITEFFSDEKRELVSIDELPRNLIYALVTREDKNFFQHHGFSVWGTARAAFNIVTGNYVSGGSTLTQQLAGYLYADRSKFTIARKLKELWWAFELEKHWTKYEILEKYLNTMNFGHGNYGVEAASQYFFGHSARDLTVAESVMLVIQLANPSVYSPIRHPNVAREMQRKILNQMVELGYATQDEVDLSFSQYWSNYDFTRSNTSTAFFDRQDKAPYFSEYVRYQLENKYLLGSLDIYKDGFVVHTTLDLDYQKAAQNYMSSGLAHANAVYQQNVQARLAQGTELVPVVDLLSLAFNIPNLRVADAKQRQEALAAYQKDINPLVDVISLMFGTSDQDPLHYASRISYRTTDKVAKRTTVEGALITLDDSTGHILAMIGGSKFESRNQFNRAVDAAVEPGSSFKPLYYSAAIENKVITPATMIYDSPVVFWNDDGTPYTPQNYKGEWEGPVLARYALAHSMNVPSLRVLERVGFGPALHTAARLLGIPEREMVSRNLVRRYPVGLGIVEVAPIEMAKAFATFANQGRQVTPIAIQYIEDRSGKIIMEPEKDLRMEQQKNGGPPQILTPQTAYIMTNMLQSTVKWGTLSYASRLVDGFNMPMAGKTGTTQNWADAWTVGFSPYYTTAIWFGFDKGGGNSLGTNQTGAVTTGPVWARYMKKIHQGLPPKDFVEPATGITHVTVSARSGLLPTEDYKGPTIDEVFLTGTEPKKFDTMQKYEEQQEPVLVERLRNSIENQNFRLDVGGLDNYQQAATDLFDLDVNLSADLGDSSASTSGDSKTTTSTTQEDQATNPLLE